MAINFQMLVEHAKDPVKLIEWVETLSHEELIQLQTMMIEGANELYEALIEWADEVGSEGINDAIRIVQDSTALTQSELLNLQEDYENQYGLDCTEANEIINRVKKESL